jgi:hypothetical protein
MAISSFLSADGIWLLYLDGLPHCRPFTFQVEMVTMSNSEGTSTVKECSRKSLVKIEKVADLKSEPKDNQCHVYYIHRDGTTYCRPDQNFDHDTKTDATEIDTPPLRGDDSPVVNNEARNIGTTEIANDSLQNSSESKTQEIEQCSDDRLILV